MNRHRALSDHVVCPGQQARRYGEAKAADSQPAATMIGLIFAGALSAFFDQDR
jgi:hypothetical protein